MSLLLAMSALGIGGLLAVQASANQQLNKAMGTPYGASTLQLGLAALVLAALALASGTLGAVTTAAQVEPPWLLLGGLASPLYITAGILLFPRLGAATSVGLFVAGQVLASLVLDTSGALGVPQETLDAFRLLGALAVVIGVGVVVRAQRARAQGPAPVSGGHPGWVVLGLAAGAVLPLQAAVNARLRGQVGAPLAVGTISFTVATLAIALVLALLLAARATPRPRVAPLARMPWWGWLGGLCAAAYVTGTFLLLPVVGAAPTVALTVTGQQVVSAAIDQFGWLGMARRPLSRLRGSGLSVLLAGAVVVQLA
jgi:transporter family-2 protein